MEETVPHASNQNSGMSNRQSHIQQRPTAAAASTSTSSVNSNNDYDNDHHHRRRPNSINTTSMLVSSLSIFITNILLKPILFMITKLLLLMIILFKVILYPIRKLSNVIFPYSDTDFNDNNNGDGGDDKAAIKFVNMFSQQYINTSSLSSTSTACPFTPTSYIHTIQTISNQITTHKEAITTLLSSSSLGGVSSIYDSIIPPSPPLLLIYLHSPFHPLSSTFCQNVLSSTRILNYLNESRGINMTKSNTVNNNQNGNDNNDSDNDSNDIDSNQQHHHVQNKELVCWGGSIHTADGKYVEKLMNVTSFPFLALVQIHPQNSTTTDNTNNSTSPTTTTTTTQANLEIYFKMEGYKLSSITPMTLYTYLSKSIQQYTISQNENLSTQITRQEEINLRTEQDKEYKAALEEAQRKMKEKEEMEKKKLEEERKMKEEEQKRLEEEKKMKMEQEGKVEEAKRVLFMYGEEPSGDNDCGAGGDKCTRIRLMLPSGQRIERKFRSRETIDTVKSFLIVYFEERWKEEQSNGGDGGSSSKIENFQLCSNYPRKVLEDGSATLESEGLSPQAVIMVQDLDA